MNLPAPSTQEDVAHILDVLTFGEIEVEGRLVGASNVALLGWLTLGDVRTRVIYKPIEGERPLWDLSLIHISEPTRRTPISYAVFCLKKKKSYIRIRKREHNE